MHNNTKPISHYRLRCFACALDKIFVSAGEAAHEYEAHYEDCKTPKVLQLLRISHGANSYSEPIISGGKYL